MDFLEYVKLREAPLPPGGPMGGATPPMGMGAAGGGPMPPTPPMGPMGGSPGMGGPPGLGGPPGGPPGMGGGQAPPTPPTKIKTKDIWSILDKALSDIKQK